MLSRFAVRGFTILSPYVQKQRNPMQIMSVYRLLSQTPTFNVSIQNDEDPDLLFDLGRTTNSNEENKTKNINKSKNVNKSRKNVQYDENMPNDKHEQKLKNKTIEKLSKEKKNRSFEQLKYHDLGLNLTYVKLPFQHPGLENLMLMLKSRKYRNQKNLLLIEGRRLTLEAIDAGLKLKYLFFSHLKQIETIRDHIEPAFMKDTEIFRVPHNDLTYWSTLTTCPGLITVFEKPNDMHEIWENVVRNKSIQVQKKYQNVNETMEKSKLNENYDSDVFLPVPITVICDQVREPNNLGGIIRTCASVPCTKIILLKGCADPWDIKALRGGCGAQFRIEIVGPVEWEELPQLLPKTDEVSVFIADNRVIDDNTTLPYDEFDQKRKEKMVKFIEPKVYSDIPFFNCKHIALIIGGETEGVSSHALDFMRFVTKHTKSTIEQPSSEETNTETITDNVSKEVTMNTRPDNALVKIPLGNGVESLNASVATAVLLFEIRKQLTN